MIKLNNNKEENNRGRKFYLIKNVSLFFNQSCVEKHRRFNVQSVSVLYIIQQDEAFKPLLPLHPYTGQRLLLLLQRAVIARYWICVVVLHMYIFCTPCNV